MFEHLDDDLPFRPDPSLRAAVRRDGRRRRAKRRGAATAGTLAIPAALTAGLVTAVHRLKPEPVSVEAAGQTEVDGTPAQLNTGDLSRPFTLLAVGTDGGGRTDAMMVVEIDPPAGRMRVVSVPRDLWVTLPDGSASMKVNRVLAHGRETLIATVNRALGVTIDHYVETHEQGFAAFVDAVDGVPVVAGAALRDQHTGLALEPGCQVLDGRTALALARSRYLEVRDESGAWEPERTYDLGRATRQQVLGAAAAARAGHLDAGPSLLRLGEALVGNLRATNLDIRQAGELTRWAGRLGPDGLRSMTPTVVERTIDQQAVFELAPGAAEQVQRFLAGEEDPVPPTTVPGAPPPAAHLAPAPGGAC